MKKLVLLILICASIGCKTRKLSKSSETIQDKTRTEQSSQVQKESQTTAEKSTTTETKFSDQSGTWTWEKWYPSVDNSDTSNSEPSPVYTRTSFVKNDITKTEKAASTELENHSEITDSAGASKTQKDLITKTSQKDLEAKSEPLSWVWLLAGLTLICFALIFIIKRHK